MVLFCSATAKKKKSTPSCRTEKASRRRMGKGNVTSEATKERRLEEHKQLGRARSAAARTAASWASWQARWLSAGFVAWSFGRLRVASPSQNFGRLREDLPV